MIPSIVIAVLFSAWRIARRLLFFLHIAQLEGYRTDNYGHWLGTHLSDAVFRVSHAIGLILILTAVGVAGVAGPSLLPLLFLLWAAAFASSRRYRRDRPKKPLVLTWRARRGLGSAVTLVVLAVAGGVIAGLSLGGWTGAAAFLAGLYLADLLAPYLILVGSAAMQPVERGIQEGFKRKATARIERRGDLKIVAVTGSYGKTSVKFAIDEILSHRFASLATPGSYNTPMGICRVVNNELTAAYQIMIVEMGIRRPGDIRELCSITPPDVAVVTSVGVAHLESMGSMEAVASEKGSLLSFVRPGGAAVLNADDERVAAMADGFDGRVWFVSGEGRADADIRAGGIEYGPDGARFDVTDETGVCLPFETRLIGRHNVTNLLMGVAVGRIFGLRLRQIRLAVAKLTPIPHRLELRREGAVTVIDDAFNSNPIGARNALEILGMMRSGRRIVVTPGMIELGGREHDENRAFGACIAKNADLAVLVGEERTRPIAEGLQSADFPADRIRVVTSLFEARNFLQVNAREGDVVLFENDLPDQFNES